jgi:hypothetical protein
MAARAAAPLSLARYTGSTSFAAVVTTATISGAIVAAIVAGRRFWGVGIALRVAVSVFCAVLASHSPGARVGFGGRVVSGGGRVARVSGSGLAVRVVVLSVHSGAMRPAAGATLASARATALVHAAKLKKEILTAYETHVSRVRARWNAARLCLRLVSRPQRGELTRLGRGCPVRRYYFAALAPKPLVSEGWGRCPRVRPEGRVSRVVPADRTSIATGFDPRNPALPGVLQMPFPCRNTPVRPHPSPSFS